jgi:hypothetical protein
MGGGKQKKPATGFFAMPQDYQDFYSQLLGQARGAITPGGKLNTAAFTPMAETPQETRALSILEKGFAPTPESLKSDISMLMNPYNQFVIDEMNRQAGGEYSLLKQAMGEAGQFGSNRQMLGASDIDLRRTGQIGQFLQNQYNQAQQDALRTLPALRSADVQGLMGIGEFRRGMDTQTKQAPIAALQAGYNVLNAVPTQFGQFGSPQQTVKTGGGFLSNLVSTVAPMALGAGGFGFSTGGQGLFSGGLGNMFGSLRGAYGPGF